MAEAPPVTPSIAALPITGGCKCGAVRYAADAPPIGPISLCHCRMCQKAYGSAFGALVSFPADSFRFVSGRPKGYRSSKIAVRGFCETCGTPLTFTYDAEPEQMAVTIGSLDHPEIAPPVVHWGVESWCRGCTWTTPCRASVPRRIRSFRAGSDLQPNRSSFGRNECEALRS